MDQNLRFSQVLVHNDVFLPRKRPRQAGFSAFGGIRRVRAAATGGHPFGAWNTRTMAGPARVSGPPTGQGYLERRPVRALAGLVSSVWVQRVGPGADPYPHRTIPNGTVELRCRVGSAAQIAGPLTGRGSRCSRREPRWWVSGSGRAPRAAPGRSVGGMPTAADWTALQAAIAGEVILPA